MAKKQWKRKVIQTTDHRKGVVEKKSKPNKRGYVTVETDTMDIGQIESTKFTYDVGDEVSYKLETVELTEEGTDNSFETTSFIDVSGPLRAQPLKVTAKYNFNKLLFVDIETARLQKNLNPKSEEFTSWAYKRRKYEESTQKDLKASYNTDAALYSEFAKIVCISFGWMGKDGELILRSVYGDDEKKLLNNASIIIDSFCSKGFEFCGLGIKGFDVPFMFRRMLVNKIPVPDCLDISGLKPWEINMLDLGEVWKSTGYYSASLLNITTALGLPSPKDNIDGSQVSDAYHGGRLEEIVQYCEKDTQSCAQIATFMFARPLIKTVISKTFEKDGDKEKK